MAEPDNVLTKLHDLLLYTVPQLAKMPRDQKFLLGDRIETKMLEVLEHAIRAYYRKDKRPHLLEANMALEIIRKIVAAMNAPLSTAQPSPNPCRIATMVEHGQNAQGVIKNGARERRVDVLRGAAASPRLSF